MQFQCAMSLAAMQENRYAGNGDVRDHHSKNKYLPTRSAGKAVAQEINNKINKIAHNITTPNTLFYAGRNRHAKFLKNIFILR